MTLEESKLLAHRVRAERMKLGLSASELARRTGLNVGTITRLEKGQLENPRTENLLMIGGVLNISASDIMALRHPNADPGPPSVLQYLRQKFSHLPASTHAEMERLLLEMADRVTPGPGIREDDY